MRAAAHEVAHECLAIDKRKFLHADSPNGVAELFLFKTRLHMSLYQWLASISIFR
jgi:hypothetical protein